MSLNYSSPVVNPRLGSSFAIFASTYVSLVIILVILEQLGLPASTVDRLIVVAPACFYIAIGFMARTSVLEDFYISGQRVPPLYNALALCATVFGGTILLGTIGTFFFIGIDALAIPLGCLVGLVLTAVLYVPYLRKAGAYTLPGFFYLRFGRNLPRAVAAVLTIVPCGAILLAEIVLGSKIANLFLPNPDVLGFGVSNSAFFAAVVFGSVFLTVCLGGMRSATWVQCAQFIVVLGLLGPLFAVSIMRTNLPLPQLTYGSQLEQIKSYEQSKGFVTKTQPSRPSLSIPKASSQPIERPVERPFSALQPIDFVLLVLCIALGVASHPSFIPRLSTTPTVPGSRRFFGWAAAIGAFIVLTLPAYALFTKGMVVEGLIGVPAADIPNWGKMLQQFGVIKLPASQFETLNAPAAATFQRDFVAFILPVAGRLPRVFLGLAAASAIAALMASASAQLVAIANSVSDDLYYGSFNRSASPARRFLVGRVSMLITGAAILSLAQAPDLDPLRLVLMAFSISAGTFFAVLTLSVWWRGLSAAGATAGMVAGFAVTLICVDAGQSGFLGIDSLIAASLGVPASFIAAICVSIGLVRADDLAKEAVDELRLPVGETLQARMVRLSSRGKPLRPA